MHNTLSPAPMPDGVTQQIHTNVMAAIRRKRKLRRVRKVVGWAAAAAAVVLVGIGVWHFRPGQHYTTANDLAHHPSTMLRAGEGHEGKTDTLAYDGMDEDLEKDTEVSSTTSPEVPKKTALALAFDEAPDAKAAFRLLTDAYDEAANQPQGGDFSEMIALCLQLRQRWPGSQVSLDSMKLISCCYTQLAEPKKAQDAFLAYADELGATSMAQALKQGDEASVAGIAAVEATAGAIHDEARRLFALERDDVASLRYCEVLMTRYPRSEWDWAAKDLEARCYERQRLFADAARIYDEVASSASDPEASRRARKALPQALFNAGRYEDGIQSWLDYAHEATLEAEKACGYYHAAFYMAVRGMGRDATTQSLLNEVALKYPQTAYGRDARTMFAKLTQGTVNQEYFGTDKGILDIVNDSEFPAIPARQPEMRFLLMGVEGINILGM